MKKTQFGYNVINAFLSEAISKEPVQKLIGEEMAGAVGKTLGAVGKVLMFAVMIDAIITAKKKLDSEIILQQHPFLKGDAFGADGDEFDSLYLLSVKETTRKIFRGEDGSIKFSCKTEANRAGFVMNRHVNHKETAGTTPFHYQFGDLAGLLSRKNETDMDSVSPLRTDYQRKIGVFKDKLETITGSTAGDMINKLSSGTNLDVLVKDSSIGLNYEYS